MKFSELKPSFISLSIIMALSLSACGGGGGSDDSANEEVIETGNSGANNSGNTTDTEDSTGSNDTSDTTGSNDSSGSSDTSDTTNSNDSSGSSDTSDTTGSNDSSGSSDTSDTTNSSDSSGSNDTSNSEGSAAIDETAPIITLNGPASVDVFKNGSYTEAGATANDETDGNLSSNIIIGGDNVDTSADIGSEFTITYNVSDTAGNAATEVTRTVTVIADDVDPVITLNGLSILEIIQGASFEDPKGTVSDNIDTLNFNTDVIVGGDIVDTNAAVGTTFTITYNVTDSSGNPAIEAIRTVSIIEAPAANVIPELPAATIQHYLDTINAARGVARTCGAEGFFPAVPAVTWNNQLYQAAYEHNQDMAISNTFSHDGSFTESDWTGLRVGHASTMVERVESYGYEWSALSENLTAGTFRDTAQEAIDSWIASDGHCKNLMSPNVTEVGMAHIFEESSTYSNYWTQNFGRPAF